MSDATRLEYPPAPAESEGRSSARRDGRGQRVGEFLSFGNIGAVYVWLVIIGIFWVWVPATFPTEQTLKSVFNDSAVTGLVALSLTVPLAARVFDLSVTANVGLCNMLVAYLLAHTTMGYGYAICLTLALSLVVGLVNVVVVVVLKIDSFIGTLATGALIGAATTLVSNDEPINSGRISGGFADVAGTQVLGLTIPVFYMLAVAAIVWFMLEYTATGRRVYATGFNVEGARLAGIKTRRLQALTLMVSAFIAGIVGIVLTSRIGAGSPGIGPPYLLIGFAAAFLGATQLKHGRFNSWGTVIAVLLLGTGTQGLSLAAAPTWASSVFTGVTLIAALAVTGFQRRDRGKATREARRAPDDPAPVATA
jgi:ribose transport system permease protein